PIRSQHNPNNQSQCSSTSTNHIAALLTTKLMLVAHVSNSVTRAVILCGQD
ncbi:hypothetical protein SOVF_129310, partial [Spinacia oleracea]